MRKPARTGWPACVVVPPADGIGETMTEEQQTLLLIRGTIAGMPENDQAQVKAIAETLRSILKSGGAHASVAFALVGAEQAAE